VTSDQCVLYTAAAARMHDFDVWVPADCTATLSDDRNQAVLRHLEQVLGARTTASDGLILPGEPGWHDDSGATIA
jgi:nicotinamidase-related amidase